MSTGIEPRVKIFPALIKGLGFCQQPPRAEKVGGAPPPKAERQGSESVWTSPGGREWGTQEQIPAQIFPAGLPAQGAGLDPGRDLGWGQQVCGPPASSTPTPLPGSCHLPTEI